MSLPFPPLGNDLEALQILLCFCRSNLHPRSAARSESTLVSTVSNIYLSQQTRDKPGSCWSLETSRHNYQLATRSLPAERALLREDDSTDWICLPTAFAPASAQEKTNIYHLIPAFTFCVYFTSHFFPALLNSISFSVDFLCIFLKDSFLFH